MSLATRAEAKAAGEKKYFTGKPCKHGHISERYTCTGQCVRCISLVYFSNKDELNKKRKKEYSENKERFQKYRADNKDRINTYNRNYKRGRPHIHRKNNMTRHAAKMNATPCWLTEAQLSAIELVYRHARDCEVTVGERYHVDHIVPLRGKNVCGLHVPWNLQVIPSDVNLRKYNKEVIYDAE